jgi:hypothetical protein
MDNDNLIDQARHLYAVLHVEQHTRSLKNTDRFDRLDRLVEAAYSRYQRRLNRCVLCYRLRLIECDRERSKQCNRDLWNKIMLIDEY